MTEHPLHGGSFDVTKATLGRARLGSGTLLIDEDVLRLLLLESPNGEKAIQIRYESIIGVATAAGCVTISFGNGNALTLHAREALAIRAFVLAACRSLPEVTRALRALGSRRTSRGARRSPTDKEGRFFAPLIAARRSSMDARDAVSVIAAFDARRLSRDISATVVDFAAEGGVGHPARRRALEAELGDAMEQLSVSLRELEELADRAAADVDDLARWRSWAAGVQRVFEAADRSWMAIDPILHR